MRISLKLAACAAVALAALSGCGEERGPDGLTSEERQKLDDHAANIEKADVTDTSPDSLTLDENAVEGEEAQPPAGNAAAAESPDGNNQ